MILPMYVRRFASVQVIALLAAGVIHAAASLPTHGPLRILVVGDNANATGEVKLLFGGKYSSGDTTPHLLGFTHRRQSWWGAVVGWQPAEYQPDALNVNGWQFQILANAIVYASTANITLMMTKGAGADVALNRSRGQGPIFFVSRAATPTPVIAPANQIGTTTLRNYSDTPPAGTVFYQVTEP